MRTLYDTMASAAAMAATLTASECDERQEDRWTYTAQSFGSGYIVAMHDETGTFVNYL